MSQPKQPYDDETLLIIIKTARVLIGASSELNHPLGHFIAGTLECMLTAIETGTTIQFAAEMCAVCDRMERVCDNEVTNAYKN